MQIVDCERSSLYEFYRGTCLLTNSDILLYWWLFLLISHDCNVVKKSTSTLRFLKEGAVKTNNALKQRAIASALRNRCLQSVFWLKPRHLLWRRFRKMSQHETVLSQSRCQYSNLLGYSCDTIMAQEALYTPAISDNFDLAADTDCLWRPACRRLMSCYLRSPRQGLAMTGTLSSWFSIQLLVWSAASS
jgi:hypothetical protein